VVFTALDTGYKKFKARHKKAQKDPAINSGVMTGIKDIDYPMQGLRDSEFGLVTGPTGTGKSILLMNFAVNCWLCHGDAVIATIEMSRDEYMDRIYSFISHIKFSRFRNEKLNPREWAYLDMLQNKFERHQHKMHIIDMPNGCNMLALKSNIDRIRQKRPVKGIFIDYINIMADRNNEVNLDWQAQVELAISMKLDIARQFGIATWTVAQTTQDNNGAAFSSHIRDQVDVGIALKPDTNTQQNGFLPAKFFKTRNFKAARFVLETNYSIMSGRQPNLKLLKKAQKLEEFDAKLDV
jgi:replicative DNA helicase